MQTTAESTLPRTVAAPKSVSASQEASDHGGTDAIIRLVQDLSETMDVAIGDIKGINAKTKLLALDARIEAARAGAHGAAFGVVATEIQNLSTSTSEAANLMASKTRDTIRDLVGLIRSGIRGTRLGDLALTNIDLIDRNLYERTCDVRWWATDTSLVDALVERSESAFPYASKRMAVILNAYTVYFDLVLADLNGKVVANGRPSRFASVGQDVSRAAWFTRALATRSGDEFAFESAHRNRLVDDEVALIYSATVRKGGESGGDPIGVLGVIFDWEGLAQNIVNNVPLSDEERESTRTMIVDAQGRVLADSAGRQLEETLASSLIEPLRDSPKGYRMMTIDGRECCVGFARAPGFETYSTAWNSLIVQPI
jgi:hypothetical protein